VSLSLSFLTGCSEPAAHECAALLDVDARLHREVQSHPDAKTTLETVANWRDTAKAVQAERDALARLSFHDPWLARWASRLREELPFHADVARSIAEAIHQGDWEARAELVVRWEERSARIDAVTGGVAAYCEEHVPR
jgi:hypothetical protein